MTKEIKLGKIYTYDNDRNVYFVPFKIAESKGQHMLVHYYDIGFSEKEQSGVLKWALEYWSEYDESG